LFLTFFFNIFLHNFLVCPFSTSPILLFYISSFSLLPPYFFRALQ
jgi:hypothetical protein